MEVRTDFPSSMYHTKLQWAQLGKALNVGQFLPDQQRNLLHCR